MTRCARCILSEDYPGVRFDANGVCNYCHSWDRQWKDWDPDKATQVFEQLCAAARKRTGPYECLVPFSGGRDSSYVLYILRTKFNLRPLAVTFNNGFLSDAAVHNIFHVVKALGVPHVLDSFDWESLRRMYAATTTRCNEFCSICSAGIRYVVAKYQQLHRIPLVVWGSSLRVDETSPFRLTTTHPTYLRRVLTGSVSTEVLQDYLRADRNAWPASKLIWNKLIGADYQTVNLPDYMRWDNSEIQAVLRRELDWRSPDEEKDHIDCRFAPVKYFLKEHLKPGAMFKQGKLSNLVRDGQITREKAIEQWERAVEESRQEPEEFAQLLQVLKTPRESVFDGTVKSQYDYVSEADLVRTESLGYRLMALPWRIAKAVLR